MNGMDFTMAFRKDIVLNPETHQARKVTDEYLGVVTPDPNTNSRAE